jgi:hypothetical protein
MRINVKAVESEERIGFRAALSENEKGKYQTRLIAYLI